MLLYLLHHVGLDDVAHVLVVELLYLDTALVACGDFLDVVLEAAQEAISPSNTTMPSRTTRTLQPRWTLPLSWT